MVLIINKLTIIGMPKYCQIAVIIIFILLYFTYSKSYKTIERFQLNTSVCSQILRVLLHRYRSLDPVFISYYKSELY